MVLFITIGRRRGVGRMSSDASMLSYPKSHLVGSWIHGSLWLRKRLRLDRYI